MFFFEGREPPPGKLEKRWGSWGLEIARNTADLVETQASSSQYARVAVKESEFSALMGMLVLFVL